jgi:hypothetical protein
MHNKRDAKSAAFLLFNAYADRKYNGAAMTEQSKGEQIAFPNQNHYYKEPQPARNMPAREQLIQATRAPVTCDAEGEYDLEEDPRYYDTRLPTSTRRYHFSPEGVYRSGNTRYHVRYVDVPPRKSRHAQLPPGHERHSEAHEVPPQRGRRQGTRLHPLAWLGVFGIFLVLGWFGLNAFTTWYQGVQDNLTYGKQRHFEINAVVGHNDSPQHPSHFTAENNNGRIIVIELPGGDVSKAKIYQIETVPGNAGNPPVKLMFQDMNGDAKPDMIVQIGDGSAMIYLTLFNNGTEFVSKL